MKKKKEKSWYIDQNGKEVMYDVTDDTKSGWWNKIKKNREAVGYYVDGYKGKTTVLYKDKE